MTRLFVTNVVFGDATVAIEWLDDTAIREPGMVRSNFIELPADAVEFADEADDAVKAVEALLRKALGMWDDAPTAVEPHDIDDSFGDDEPGPYDNPLERELPTTEGPQ